MRQFLVCRFILFMYILFFILKGGELLKRCRWRRDILRLFRQRRNILKPRRQRRKALRLCNFRPYFYESRGAF